MRYSMSLVTWISCFHSSYAQSALQVVSSVEEIHYDSASYYSLALGRTLIGFFLQYDC